MINKIIIVGSSTIGAETIELLAGYTGEIIIDCEGDYTAPPDPYFSDEWSDPPAEPESIPKRKGRTTPRGGNSNDWKGKYHR